MLLLAQGGFIALFATGVYLRTPDTVSRFLESQLQSQKVHVSLDGLKANARGQVRIASLQLSSIENDELLFEAKDLRLAFSPTALLAGRAKMRAIGWEQIKAWCPIKHSPTGLPKDWLHIQRGTLHLLRNDGKISPLKARIGEADLRLSGRFALPESPGDTAFSIDNYIQPHSEIAGRILDFFENQKPGFKPHIHLHLKPLNEGQTTIRMLTQLKPFEASGDFPANWESGYIQSEVLLKGEEISILNLSGKLLDFSFRDFEASSISIRLQNPLEWAVRDGSFQHLDLWLDIEHCNVNILNINRASANLRYDGDFAVHGIIGDWGNQVRFNWSQGANGAQDLVAINGYFDPLVYLSDLNQLPERFRENTVFRDPVNLQASARMESYTNLETVDADFRIQTGLFSVGNLSGSSLYGEGQWKDNKLELDHFRLQGRDRAFELSGSYYRNLNEKTFRTLLSGTLIPMEIAPIFQDWWTNLWRRFEFKGEPPEIDFYIWGTFDGPQKGLSFGFAEGAQFTFEGIELKDFSGRIWVLPAFFELFDVVAISTEGHAVGSFAQVYNRPEQRPRSVTLDMTTRLPLSVFPAIFGEDLDPFVSPIESRSAPELAIRGKVIHPEETDIQELNGLSIRGRFQESLTLFGVSLDKLNFHLNTHDNKIQVEEFQAGIAEGLATGKLRYQLDDNQSVQNKLSFELTLEEAHFRAFLQAIPQLQEIPGFSDLDPEDVDRDRSNISGQFSVKGDPDNWKSFEGDTSFLIRDPELARLRFFGIFSRILETVLLPVGTLQFREAEIELTLQREIIQVEKFQIEGPSSRVRATGQIFLENNEMDLNAVAFILQATRIPIFHQLSQILNPISQILEFRLYGPVNQPRWRFAIDPRNIFSPGRDTD